MSRYFHHNQNTTNTNKGIRKGLSDVWNSFMVKGAKFSKNDIPFCPTTAKSIPNEIITYEEAKIIYKSMLKKRIYDFYYENIYVCFYIDDQKFDSSFGIWFRSKIAIRILRHFGGVITPDFSTYADFPFPIKIFNTYRMRAFGHHLTALGFNVINNVRWGTDETYSYCFDGIDKNSIVAIGTVGSNLKLKINQTYFEKGFAKMIKVLSPKILLVYGSSNYPCFKKSYMKGIKVISFESHTCKYFKNRYNNE